VAGALHDDDPELTGRFPADFELAVGSRLRITPREDRLHIFDGSDAWAALSTRQLDHPATTEPVR
jgi:hypothetical protein